jgi:hypothetical protein
MKTLHLLCRKAFNSLIHELTMKRAAFAVLIFCLGCVGQKKSYNVDESRDIAREFVLTSPTYLFDGKQLTHIDTKPLQCSSCWQFTFEFTSSQGGYGDRSGKMVIQVITPHTAVITVENGKVTHAVLDDHWDMINQTMIEE